MGNVTTSEQNNITSPNGNSLAVFVEGTTGEMKVKDINGNIQPLSDFIILGASSPFEYNANATGIQPILGTNDASGTNATIGGGQSNTASGCYSIIGGGRNNTASGSYSGILSGKSNNTNSCACAMIVGSNITANRICATFVNNLSIVNIPTSSAGLPTGSVWRNGTVLEIIP